MTLAASACTSILGIDHDYRAAPAGSTSGGDGAASATDGAAFPADPGAVVKVVAGKFHACALFSSGVAKCWGRNDDYLELGDGSGSSTSVPMPAMGGGLSDLFAGAHQTCATIAAGAECAGRGDQGQLGDGSSADSSVPVRATAFAAAPVQVASGEAFLCALLPDGGVWCVGDGTHGELGDGASHASVVPVQARLAKAAQAVAAFDVHACALLVDGTVSCWGDDSFGQLGDGQAASGAGAPAPPGVVVGLAGATAIGVGVEHSCALVGGATSGAVWCWGGNESGQLGDGTTTSRARPVRVQGATGATLLAVGGFHACAGLLDAGVVACWGKGGSGELGDGRSTNASTPVAVVGISYPESLAAGGFHTCALVASPNVVCWGSNDFGQLGNGDAPNQQARPAQVAW